MFVTEGQRETEEVSLKMKCFSRNGASQFAKPKMVRKESFGNLFVQPRKTLKLKPGVVPSIFPFTAFKVTNSDRSQRAEKRRKLAQNEEVQLI